MRKLWIVAGALAVLVGAGRVSAHEGHVHKVMGIVTLIDATHVEVDATDGSKQSFLLTADTKFLKGKKAAVASDVKVGARVVLSVVQKDGKKNVTEALIGQAPKAEAAPHKH